MPITHKIFSVILSPIYWILFGVTLLFFHLLAIISYTIGKRKALQPITNAFYFTLNGILAVLFIRTKWTFHASLPTDKPIIFISNHKHRYDIPAIYWFARKYGLRWVSKRELAKGVPAISYILRKTENALINREKPDSAVREIIKLAKSLEKNKGSVVIFPEGTRSHGDKLRPFKSGGISLLLEHAPSAIIVPLAITNTQLINDGLLMKPFFTCYWDVLPPIERENFDGMDISKMAKKLIEEQISKNLVNSK